MDFIETLTSFFNKPKTETKGKTPDGFCPNCWGFQEYDNKIRDMYIEKQIDINNHKANYSFIQKFLVTNIDGIRLRKDQDGIVCPNCKTSYNSIHH